MKNWSNFIEEGLKNVVNEYGEIRTTRKNSIVFPNGYVGSIMRVPEGYSIAVCDWNGYFDWNVFEENSWDKYGGVLCLTENDVCECLSLIESLPSIL